MIALASVNGHFAGHVDGANVWPVTYLMLEAVEGGAVLFLYIVCHALRRRTHLARARHPLRRHPRRAAHARDHRLALQARRPLLRRTRLLTVAGLCGIIMQTVAGYYHYELLQYAKELYLVVFPQVLIFILARALRSDRRLEQVHRPRHRHRASSSSRRSCRASAGKTRSTSSATPPPSPTRT